MDEYNKHDKDQTTDENRKSEVWSHEQTDENKYVQEDNVKEQNESQQVENRSHIDERPTDENAVSEQAIKEQAATRANAPTTKNAKKGRFGFLKMIGAAVIGSALTLGVVTQTDLLQDEPEVEEVVKEEPAESESEPATNVSTNGIDISDIIEQSSEAIVGITNFGNQQNPFQPSSGEVEQGTGSGVIYEVNEKETYIITNHHVIDGANKVSVSLHDGETVEAKLVGTDPLTDTAVIKIAGEYDITPLPFGDSDEVRSGESVIAIGNPLGLELSRTVTQGIISAIDRSINVQTAAGEWELDVIQTDAAINPGNSGGALINNRGELIGINSLKIASNNVEGLGFAIPSNDVKSIVSQLRDNNQVERPYLGVGMQDVRTIPSFYMPSLPDKVKAGAIIVSVDSSSAAGKAGLKEEDIIVKMDDYEIESDKDVRKFLYKEAEIGDDVKITFYRNGKKQSVDLTLTSNLTEEVS